MRQKTTRMRMTMSIALVIHYTMHKARLAIDQMAATSSNATPKTASTSRKTTLLPPTSGREESTLKTTQNRGTRAREVTRESLRNMQQTQSRISLALTIPRATHIKKCTCPRTAQATKGRSQTQSKLTNINTLKRVRQNSSSSWQSGASTPRTRKESLARLAVPVRGTTRSTTATTGAR